MTNRELIQAQLDAIAAQAKLLSEQYRRNIVSTRELMPQLQRIAALLNEVLSHE